MKNVFVRASMAHPTTEAQPDRELTDMLADPLFKALKRINRHQRRAFLVDAKRRKR